jgi:starch synthase
VGEKLKILFIASEMAPFIKTGGLGDVVSVLPKVLSDLGHEVMCVIPKYQDLNLGTRFLFETARAMNVWMGTDEEWCSVFKVEEGGIPVFLIENHKYFTRPLLYHDREFKDYADNPARFAFFTRAALDTARLIKFKADIVHVHDWQSALAPAYLKTWHWNDPVLARAASVLTIHNATYQGIYPASWYPYLGLSKKDYNPDGFECYGGVNFLKGGIVFADAVNTVSPTYAKEISAPYSPPGLAPYLTNKGDAFLGILNGVDYDTWNPQTDIFIPARYSNSDKTGKKQCKRELQKRFGLKDDPDVLLIGVVGRFTDQKGYALLSACVDDIMHDMAVQFVILGSGDPGLESFFREIPKRHPGRAGSWIGYDERLSHMIEAGADLFLMPSLFEPCGLNQLYSLKYGTLPLVRSTGGLEDTVEQYDEARGEGTGFKFWDPKPEALYYTVGWAVSTYYDRRAHWDRMVDRAMAKEFSWTDSGNRYLELYEKAKNRKFDWDKRFIIK